MTDRLDLPRRCGEALLREHVPNAVVWAYGRSRVNGRCHSGSDLDLAPRSPTLEPLGGGSMDVLEPLRSRNSHPGADPRLGTAASELSPGD